MQEMSTKEFWVVSRCYRGTKTFVMRPFTYLLIAFAVVASAGEVSAQVTSADSSEGGRKRRGSDEKATCPSGVSTHAL